MFDKHTQKLNLKINQLEQELKDKVKELRMQALKIKELMNADDLQRKQIISKDFYLLQSLASATNPGRHQSNDLSPRVKKKLDQLRDQQL